MNVEEKEHIYVASQRKTEQTTRRTFEAISTNYKLAVNNIRTICRFDIYMGSIVRFDTSDAFAELGLVGVEQNLEQSALRNVHR